MILHSNIRCSTANKLQVFEYSKFKLFNFRLEYIITVIPLKGHVPLSQDSFTWVNVGVLDKVYLFTNREGQST